MPTKPILRFAPSPNGPLHLGHAYSALFTWDAAKRLGGMALLRIEDIDRTRSKPEFTAAILADLHWLGLTWPTPVMHQSQRSPAYMEAATRLRELDLLYPCFCSRSEIAERAHGADPDGAPLYRGTCRNLPPEIGLARIAAGEIPQYRLDMGRATAMTGPLMVTIAGPLVTDDGKTMLGSLLAIDFESRDAAHRRRYFLCSGRYKCNHATK